MALSSTINWELRATATAANANGGGFKPGATGTDYSRQDAAQYNLTGVTSAAANAIMLSTSASVDMVGNVCHVTGGTNATTGWYEILSVVAGVSITVDRNWCSAAALAGVVNIGGAISLGSSTTNQTDANFFTNGVVAGNVIWMKAGSYALGITFTSVAGTLLLPIMWHGYNVTRGDVPTGANRPVLSTVNFAPIINTWWTIDNISFIGTASSILNLASDCTLTNLKIVNNNTTANLAAVLTATNCLLLNCELICYRGAAINGSSVFTYVVGCYIHDSDIGITLTTGALFAFNNIISDNVTSGIQTTGTGHIFLMIGNTFYGAENKLGVALRNFNTTNFWASLNNIIYGFVTGVSMTASYPGVVDNYNDYFNNTTDVTNLAKGPNDVAANPAFGNVVQIVGTAGVISGSTLTDSAKNFSNVVDNVDFCYLKSATGATAGKYLITGHTTTSLTLSSAPGGSGTNASYQITTGHNFAVGTAVKAKAFPGAFAGSNTIGYLDIGAAQRHEYGRPAGGK